MQRQRIREGNAKCINVMAVDVPRITTRCMDIYHFKLYAPDARLTTPRAEPDQTRHYNMSAERNVASMAVLYETKLDSTPSFT